MDILDVCDPTPDRYRYILVIADYFRLSGQRHSPLRINARTRWRMCCWTKSYYASECPWLSTAIRGGKTRTAPYHPESDGMVARVW